MIKEKLKKYVQALNEIPNDEQNGKAFQLLHCTRSHMEVDGGLRTAEKT